MDCVGTDMNRQECMIVDMNRGMCMFHVFEKESVSNCNMYVNISNKVIVNIK